MKNFRSKVNVNISDAPYDPAEFSEEVEILPETDAEIAEQVDAIFDGPRNRLISAAKSWFALSDLFNDADDDS